MLETIKNTITSLLDAVNGAIDFLQTIIDKLTDFFVMVGNAVTYATQLVGTLPSWISVFAIAAISISVIYLIVGRSTSDA